VICYCIPSNEDDILRMGPTV